VTAQAPRPRFLTADWVNLLVLSFDADPSALARHVPAGTALDAWDRRKHEGAWRRGTVFVKELVPRRAAAWVARTVYNENYVAYPMRHTVAPDTVAYEWRREGAWEGMRARPSGAPYLSAEDSEQAFVTEHYWGYKSQRKGGTLEYQVEHPRWNVQRTTDAAVACDAAALYGPEFAEALARQPSTAFVADGSRVTVRTGRRL
jgi:uncharacterized protein